MNYFLHILSRHTLKEMSSLIACYKINNLHNWLVSINIHNVYNDHMIKVYILLNRKLKLSRGLAIELALITVFCQSLENSRVLFLVSLL